MVSPFRFMEDAQMHPLVKGGNKGSIERPFLAI